MKIVVRGTNWVGDAVMTIPALRELRRIFPAARIFLHTRSWAEGIFRDADFVDEILSFERSKSSFQTTLEQAKIWREHDFDLAILFPNSFETAFLAKLGKVRRRFGYGKEARGFLLTDPVPVPVWKNERHEIFYYLNLIAEIEKEYFGTTSALTADPLFQLNVSAERKAAARRILAQSGADLSRQTIAFVPGSTNSRAKRWPAGHFAELNDLVQTGDGANVVLLGADNETGVSRQVAGQSNRPPVNLTGKTTLAEAVAVLSICDLLVSNDTGPAHIAAALGTPTLVLFGPTDPATTRPWNASVIRREEVECAPCMLRDCPIDHRCLTRISATEVFEKIKSMI